MVLLSLDDPELVIRFWKPYGVLCAFTDQHSRSTLADFIDLPGVYAAGRLDRDSEGLLLLTRGKGLRADLMRPDIGHPRTYLVQVEGVPDTAALAHLSRGVALKDGLTRPATAVAMRTPPNLPPRPVPIRVRRSIPDTWIRITLTEGKNRQVRRMTAAVGYPTLRLVREAIGSIGFDRLSPGEWDALSSEQREQLRDSLSHARAASRRGHARPRREQHWRG